MFVFTKNLFFHGFGPFPVIQAEPSFDANILQSYACIAAHSVANATKLYARETCDSCVKKNAQRCWYVELLKPGNCPSGVKKVCLRICLNDHPPVTNVVIRSRATLPLQFTNALTGVPVRKQGVHMEGHIFCESADIFTVVGNQAVEGVLPTGYCLMRAQTGSGEWMFNPESIQFHKVGKRWRMRPAHVELVPSEAFGCTDPVMWIRVRVEGGLFPQKYDLGTQSPPNISLSNFVSLNLATRSTHSLEVAQINLTHAICEAVEIQDQGYTTTSQFDVSENIPEVEPKRRAKRGIVDDAIATITRPFVAAFETVSAGFVALLARCGEGIWWLLKKIYNEGLLPYWQAVEKRLSFVLAGLILAGLGYVQPMALQAKWYWLLVGYYFLWTLGGGVFALELDPRAMSDPETLIFFLPETCAMITTLAPSYSTVLAFLVFFLLYHSIPSLFFGGKRTLMRKVLFLGLPFLQTREAKICLMFLSAVLGKYLPAEVVLDFIQVWLVNPSIEHLGWLSRWPVSHSAGWIGDSYKLVRGRLVRLGKDLPRWKVRKFRDPDIPKRVKHLIGSVFFFAEWDILPQKIKDQFGRMDEEEVRLFREWSIPVSGRDFGDLDWLIPTLQGTAVRRKQLSDGLALGLPAEFRRNDVFL